MHNPNQRRATNSAFRLKNNYSDINLSNGGNMPEEYQPHGKGSGKRGLSSNNYAKVN